MSLHLLRLRRFAIKLCNDELLQMLCRNIKLFSWERENIDSLLWHWSIQIEMDTDSLVQLCENEISLWKAKSQIFCFFCIWRDDTKPSQVEQICLLKKTNFIFYQINLVHFFAKKLYGIPYLARGEFSIYLKVNNQFTMLPF